MQPLHPAINALGFCLRRRNKDPELEAPEAEGAEAHELCSEGLRVVLWICDRLHGVSGYAYVLGVLMDMRGNPILKSITEQWNDRFRLLESEIKAITIRNSLCHLVTLCDLQKYLELLYPNSTVVTDNKTAIIVVIFTRSPWWRLLDRYKERNRIASVKRDLPNRIPLGIKIEYQECK